MNILTPLLVTLLLSTMGPEHCQKSNPNANMWSPPDNSFKVEVPVRLREIEGEYADLYHDRYKSIKLFGSRPSDSNEMIFQVVILELSDKELQSHNKLDGLEFLIGGDDARPTKETVLAVDGLNSRELLFADSSGCRKGLIIDGGSRIYVLGLRVKRCDNLNLAPAKRFFESFRVVANKMR